MEVIQKNINTHLSNKEIFTSVLRNLGFTEKDVISFHAEYEKNDKEGHRAFLRFLGLTENEILKVIDMLNK